MIPPDLPAELKAALDARLHGLSRSDAAERSARDLENLSRRRRLGRDPHRDRRAGLCAGADAGDLCRRYRQPECAARNPAGFRAQDACSISAPVRAPRHGPRRRRFRRSRHSRCSMPTTRLRTLALDLCSDSSRLRERPITNAAKRATRLAKAEAADLVIASYVIGEIGEAERTRARRTDVGEDPRHAAGRRARHAGGLCADHRAARATDRAGRACRRALPARRRCPLAAPDWCHFTQRLPRSRAHKQLKGAELPFEDEKFAYVALTRAPPAQRPPACWRSPSSARSRSPPSSAPRRSRRRETPRRDKADYADARRWRWGDAVVEP